jgi:hypothetical protein
MITHSESNGDIDTDNRPLNTANLVWLVILVLTSVAASLVISCVTPFAALAVALAGTVRSATALGAMTLIWLINQFIGFFLFDFPRTLNVALWGLAICGAALLSTLAAASTIKRGKAFPVILRLGLALLFAFAAYEGWLFLAAWVLGGVETFSPAIIAQLGLRNLIWFLIMVGLNELAAVLCAPRFGKLPRMAEVTPK